MECIIRDGYIGSQTSIGHQTQEGEAVTQHVVAMSAVPARSTFDTGIGGDPVAHTHTCDTLADFDDAARKLMPQCERGHSATERMRLRGNEHRTREVLMQVGTTDPTPCNFDDSVACFRLRVLNGINL
jgi:hypothetical protein